MRRTFRSREAFTTLQIKMKEKARAERDTPYFN